jgi:hypothetical protein
MQLAKDSVATKSPPVARRPASRAFEAMLNEELAALLRAQYPEEFAATQQRLTREACIDLNDDL